MRVRSRGSPARLPKDTRRTDPALVRRVEQAAQRAAEATLAHKIESGAHWRSGLMIERLEEVQEHLEALPQPDVAASLEALADGVRGRLPPGARRALHARVAQAAEYLTAAAGDGPFWSPVEVERRPLPSDATVESGWSSEVPDPALQKVEWEGADTFVADRLGPAVHLVDALGEADRLVFSNLPVEQVLDVLPEPAAIDALRLPISGWEKSIHWAEHQDGSRSLILADLPGRGALRHFQALARAELSAREASPGILTIESPDAYEVRRLSLRDLFREQALGSIDAVMVAYARSFAREWSPYAVKSVAAPGPLGWHADIYQLPNGRRVAALSTLGTFHGGMLGEQLRALVDDVPTIELVVVAGSGGSLHARRPYSLVLPSRVRGPSGETVPNVLTSGSAGLVHESVSTPLAETRSWVNAARARQVGTVDMELGGVADALAGTGVKLGFGVVVTDFPGGAPARTRATLANQRPVAKRKAADALPALVQRYLETGAQSDDHAIERSVGQTIPALSRQNIEAEIAALGALSSEEQTVFDRVAALTPRYVLRMPAWRLPRLLDGGILSKRQVVQLLGVKVTPFTPDSEDQLYGAHDYTFGSIGFHDGGAEYGDTVVRIREDAWRARAWGSTKAGLHAMVEAAGTGLLRKGLAMISGRAREKLDLTEPAQAEQLERARSLFSRWVYAPDDFSKALAVQVVALMRRDEAVRERLVQAEGAELLRALESERAAHLEGHILGALNLADVEALVVPADTPEHLIGALRDEGVPVEIQGTRLGPDPSELISRLKSWLFVHPSATLEAEASPPAARVHRPPGQRKREALAASSEPEGE